MQPLYTEQEFKNAKSNQTLSLRCLHCGAVFNRTKSLIRASIWQFNHGRKRMYDFCSIQCHNTHVYKKPPISVTCEQCDKSFIKERSQIRQTKHNFCSQSCAAKYNNNRRPRKYLCAMCNKPIRNNKKMMCRPCLHKSTILAMSSRTKGEIKRRNNGYQQYRSAIVKHAKDIFILSGLPRKCLICGYTKHVEITHKKPVSSFPDSTTLGEINHIDNLSPLCPNHHWEHDNNM